MEIKWVIEFLINYNYWISFYFTITPIYFFFLYFSDLFKTLLLYPYMHYYHHLLNYSVAKESHNWFFHRLIQEFKLSIFIHFNFQFRNHTWIFPFLFGFEMILFNFFMANKLLLICLFHFLVRLFLFIFALMNPFIL